jgi:uroporphyrinogen-III decarboxylase
MPWSESPDSRAAAFRRRCLDLAAQHHRMVIGTDLVLHEKPDPDAIRLDGARLGAVILEAADRYDTPMAMPLMDLRVEKRDLLRRLGIQETDLDTFHFNQPLDDDQITRARETLDAPFDPLMAGQVDALRHVAQHSDRVPVGMVIGPFSLVVKLMKDPIMAVARAGRTPGHSQVVLLTQMLALAVDAVRRSVQAQAQAGAQAVCLCEPAANTVYISPKQLEGATNPFETFVMKPLEEVRATFAELDTALILHDCGELIDGFVAAFAQRLHPAMLSLGSSRVLWEDAAHVPDDVVLFGNLPTKHFYSDNELPLERVTALTCELLEKMAATGHPFILGSECDVLSVSGSHDLIAEKVSRMLTCTCR